jgi:hypothetical protein
MNSYTGVGSRDILPSEASKIRSLAKMLAEHGYSLRSGKAQGADTSFMLGAIDSDSSINPLCTNYTPWYSFGDKYTNGYDKCLQDFSIELIGQAALIAENIHPNWKACSQAARKLHTRNIFQVLGDNLDNPSHFLLACSGQDSQGDVIGGTRTAWVCAKQNNVPVFNLRGRTYEDALAWLSTIISINKV